MSEKKSATMTLDITRSPGATVITVQGSAGMQEAEMMRSTLDDLTAARVPVIILDLGGMDFICSMGLGAIIQGHLRTRHYQGQIRLARPQAEVRRLLETTRLTQLFPLYDSLEAAVKG